MPKRSTNPMPYFLSFTLYHAYSHLQSSTNFHVAARLHCSITYGYHYQHRPAGRAHPPRFPARQSQTLLTRPQEDQPLTSPKYNYHERHCSELG
ncbi:hypothetical protein PGT21_019694 [Puccinia graminis f. sp. tritici]|uniref:Uncharacterized protein n=1 Tax=Puccinia graminis f. sp. tritici TaxID=56615 RepID=A0A5B0QFW5_PUCGR|nr:hypothetical protein PGT21_019694 [Puccinia graminis f. sp. tritici]